MLTIRFQRIGRKNAPSFRIVAAEKARAAKTGKIVEILGNYNPRTKALAIEKERVLARIAHGAQPSGSMHNLLVSQGIITGKKINVLPKRTAPVKEVAAAVEAPAAAEVVAPVAEPVVAEEAAPAEEAAAPSEEPAA